MKKHMKKQVYTVGGTTFLTERDYMREVRKRDHEMHNWKVSKGLFTKGKLWRPRKQSRRVQLNKANNWLARLENRKLEQWNRERRYWSWERI